MVFNATFNNISVLSWQSVLLMEQTGVPGVVHLAWEGFKLTTLVVIGTDIIGSYKSNYHTIMTTHPPFLLKKHKFYHKLIWFFCLCRNPEFGNIAESVLENTLLNIMSEALKEEFNITSRPRFIALPKRTASAKSQK